MKLVRKIMRHSHTCTERKRLAATDVTKKKSAAAKFVLVLALAASATEAAAALSLLLLLFPSASVARSPFAPLFL